MLCIHFGPAMTVQQDLSLSIPTVVTTVGLLFRNHLFWTNQVPTTTRCLCQKGSFFRVCLLLVVVDTFSKKTQFFQFNYGGAFCIVNDIFFAIWTLHFGRRRPVVTRPTTHIGCPTSGQVCQTLKYPSHFRFWTFF